ncbi:hypothetical protein [Saliphagus infecundisoli]|uniref:Domain of unknown function domain-containing protein n=1 Tax=Saliphagus infecundisoli TaxID=1849069 RepID=A0ABD5QGM0_9EURY|nr:hypothetical protein [Saliphagus infecundisoli]
MSTNDRSRGILTPSDRAYLRGEYEPGSVQSERNTRERIRERVFESLRDFELLIEHLPERDRGLVFEKRLEELDGPEAFDALVAAMAFLYRGIEDSDADVEEVLREGVALAEADRDRAVSVEFERTFHALSGEELLRRLEDGETLSLSELAYLQRSDDVPRGELADALASEKRVEDGRIQSRVTDF